MNSSLTLIKTRLSDTWAALMRKTRASKVLANVAGKPKPIGYLPMCEILLNAGLPVKDLLQHRFVVEAIAAGCYVEPTHVDYDQRRWSFVLQDGDRSLYCEFQKISTIARYKLWLGDVIAEEGRLALAGVLGLMLKLRPLERDFTRWERIKVWVGGYWHGT